MLGREKVVRFLAGPRAYGRGFELRMQRVDVNGQPGLVIRDSEDRVISVMAADIADGRVKAVRSVVNPEKLGHLGPLADLKAMIRVRPLQGPLGAALPLTLCSTLC